MKNMSALIAEEQRRQAMLSADITTLDGLLSDGLVYVHSTGGRDSKTTYLDKLASGSLKYLSLSFEDLQVHAAGPGQVVTGRMSAQVSKDGQSRAVHSLFMTVWMPEPGAQGQQGLRMQAYQGAPCPA
jgi:ketosteroid isomerase-like protein